METSLQTHPWLQATQAYVQQTLSAADASHDWEHIRRVWAMAQRLSTYYPQADGMVVSLAALLHDIADAKFHHGDETLGATTAQAFLQNLGVPEALRAHVGQIILHLSFKGGQVQAGFYSQEFAIVQDADRLDALGAIGIARTFHYGGMRGQALYDPQIAPRTQLDPQTYRQQLAPTLNHFYEKLLLLQERLHTPEAKAIAAERHQLMQDFVKAFLTEWHFPETQFPPAFEL
ncbi:HD domain-containing protein [Eisenibacter elegans]|jgi:uncharacterized protein|uniref:HD domain-containing protein n=1 Tax=Eisenibacter elegans TaxID=997 RepID=UPI00040F8B8D|nr:HD domain-containing protein [Eisenibacter elegans]